MTDLEGDLGYLRSRLDSPGYFLTHRLGSGLIARLLRGWQVSAERPARLALIARIELGARQTVALIEAEGERLLVASSADGGVSFFPLNGSDSNRDESSARPFGMGESAGDSKPLPAGRVIPGWSGPGGRSARSARPLGRVSW
jgi:hypothetical protein